MKNRSVKWGLLAWGVLVVGCSSDEAPPAGESGSPSTGSGAGAGAQSAGAPATAGRTAGAAGTAVPASGGAGGAAPGAAGASGSVASGTAGNSAGSNAAPPTAGVGAAAGASGAIAAGSGGAVAAGAGGQSGSAGATAGGAGGSTDSGGAGGAGGAAGGGDDPGTTPPGDGGEVDETIVVASGSTFDGGGKRYTAGRNLGDGSQDENQQPVFRVEDGGKLVNVVLGSPAADGVHTYGTVTLENIVWEDIGEDALTIKESGTVTLDGGSAKDGDDKVFQVNAASTFKISNFKASNAGKFIRQNGDTTFKVEVFIDKCDISNMDEAIFRTDSSSSTVEMTNTRYSNIGDDLFIGVASGNIKESGNTEY